MSQTHFIFLMSSVSALINRARWTTRRHRVAVLMSCAVVALFVVLLSASHVFSTGIASGYDVPSINNPENLCRWLPSSLCHWSITQTSEEQPFDPQKASQAAPASGSPPTSLPNTDKKKLDFIRGYYKKLPNEKAKLDMGHQFYDKILKVLVDAKPDTELSLNYPNGKFVPDRYVLRDTNLPITSEAYLSRYLQLNRLEFDAMKKSHDYALLNLPEHAPDGLYSGNGIVYVGGGKFNWLALLSIRTLRSAGCQLPIEVLIPTLEEYELELCSRIFPAMNARCIFLPTLLQGDSLTTTKLEFKGYQYKSLAIMLSSFENVLLLDSDNVPAYAPDYLFNKDPFLSKGLIVWPDFWKRSTSPDYFKIAGVSVSKTELLPTYDERYGEYRKQQIEGDLDLDKIPLHERLGAIPDPSSESGQLMISKRTHMKELLLALYYNSYGPSHYYPLFSQGAPGEGDKETFLAATIITKKLYYQVSKFVDALGNVRDNEFKGHGMGQFDPVQDLEWNIEKNKLAKQFSGQEYFDAVDKLKKPKMIFVHANFPKLDPWKLKQKGETIDNEGNRYRLYGLGMKSRTGVDFEGEVWKHMYTLLCDLNLKVEAYQGVDRKALCTEIKEHKDWLASTEHTLE